VEELAVDADVVAMGVGFAAEFGDDLAVDLYAALGDEFFGVAAAGDSGLGKDLLKALEFRRGFRGRLLVFFRIFGGFQFRPREIIGGLLERVACCGCRLGFGFDRGVRFDSCARRFVDLGAVRFGIIWNWFLFGGHGEISVLPASIPVRRGRVQKTGLFGRLCLRIGFGLRLWSRRGSLSRRR
jgi:hypothetical protein